MIMLNKANRVSGVAHSTKRELSGSIIDTRVILQYAIKAIAHAIILAQNHPSRSLEASEADIKITRRVKEALELVDINLLDHMILNKDEKNATNNI